MTMKTTINIAGYIKILFLIPVFLILLIGISYAEDHYVSPNGSATWVQSTDIGMPCAPETAMSNAVAGDTVMFRGGQYELQGPHISYHGILEPVNSGTPANPIVFMAYPDETPVMNSTIPSGKDVSFSIGTGGKDYITWDGFVLQTDNGQKMGGMMVGGQLSSRQKGAVIRNCIFNGGATLLTSTDNREGLRIENTSNTTVQNCLFYNYSNVNNNHNTSAIKTYRNDFLTIENIEVYDCTVGIYLKHDTDDGIVRNCYIHDCYQGIYIQEFIAGSDRLKIYHNVLSDISYSNIGTELNSGTIMDDFEVYNNTIYADLTTTSTRGTGLSAGTSKVWNNIFLGIRKSVTTRIGNVLHDADHNQFGHLTPSHIFLTHLYGTDEAVHTTLFSWQSEGEHEGAGNPGFGSLDSDPKFVNLSGNMNQLSDFALDTDYSPCIGTGRGGVNMGADIDKVGIITSSATDNTPPTAPTGLTIQ